MKKPKKIKQTIKTYPKGSRIKIRLSGKVTDVTVMGQFENHVTVRLGKLVITIYPQEIVDNQNEEE